MKNREEVVLAFRRAPLRGHGELFASECAKKSACHNVHAKAQHPLSADVTHGSSPETLAKTPHPLGRYQGRNLFDNRRDLVNDSCEFLELFCRVLDAVRFGFGFAR